MPEFRPDTLVDDQCVSRLTSISLELLPGSVVVAGTMGLLLCGAVGLEQCWGMLGDTGSILTMAGAEPRQTDWDKTTGGDGERQNIRTRLIERKSVTKQKHGLPGLFWSMEGRPCRMRVLAGAGVCGTGRVVTHTGLGWMGGLVLRMELAFNPAEPGRTAAGRKQISL